MELWTDEEFDSLLETMAHEGAPRRFALCQVRGDREDGRVYAYGMQFDDHAVVRRFEEGALADIMQSAESARRMWSRIGQFRLVWIDPAPEPTEDDEDPADDDPDEDA
ncbi:hypothetical protein Lfu02_71390 [Longispora fulva]|uniref:Uncharacterized protein n=1 Tax=Longispora fulva TaxID=619741 RepID=A0A8J7KTY0_9ACTN|nr:hypothetical protein [Longispora fulva]MBG6141237.1 hypothetical protein [Longispora fulva]GIG62767.1 hypothetical protein Lfu02_71390 [Longispora fulva]